MPASAYARTPYAARRYKSSGTRTRLALPRASAATRAPRFVRPEIKRTDFAAPFGGAVAGVSVSAAGTIVPMTVVLQGDAEDARVGDSCKGKGSGAFALSINGALGATPTTCTVRYIVVRCKQASIVAGAGAPTAAALFTTPGFPITSPYSEAALRYFTVVVDKKRTLTVGNVTEFTEDLSIPSSAIVRFSQTNGQGTFDGAYYLCVFSNQGVGPISPVLVMQGSYQFTDA